jgi:hypothetical protein
MIRQVNYYKIKTTKNLIDLVNNYRNTLLTELIDYATDPVIVKRRLRMLSQLSQIESQIILKIQAFETNDVDDIDIEMLCVEIRHITNRNS